MSEIPMIVHIAELTREIAGLSENLAISNKAACEASDRIAALEMHESQLENEVEYWSKLYKQAAERTLVQAGAESGSRPQVTPGSLITQQVSGEVYMSTVNGRREFRRAFREQRARADKYGVALMMIREGCHDAKGFAARILKETPSSTQSTEEDTVNSYFADALGEQSAQDGEK